LAIPVDTPPELLLTLAEDIHTGSFAMSKQEYRLIGGAGERAKKLGLTNASWYRCDIPRPVMKQLMQRSDTEAIRDTILWYALIGAAGFLLFYSFGTNWTFPAFLLYATLYAGPADSRWHEAGHGTAFKTRWMNDWLYQVASFQVMRRPTVWRWSHARHHTDTLIPGRDPEIQVMLPIRVLDCRAIREFYIARKWRLSPLSDPQPVTARYAA